MGYDVEELVDGIQAGMSAPGGRAAIARAITLVESDRPITEPWPAHSWRNWTRVPR
ncbi:MAG: hypothetical protein R2693_11110 [Nocardioidaceae bacterium]